MQIRIDLPFTDVVDSVSKANSVQFEDLTVFDNKLLEEFKTVEDLNKFRLNLYNLYKTKVKIDFVKVSEELSDGDVIDKQWFKLSSPIFSLTDNDIWRCLPFYIVKKYYHRSKYLHKYISRENLYFFSPYI